MSTIFHPITVEICLNISDHFCLTNYLLIEIECAAKGFIFLALHFWSQSPTGCKKQPHRQTSACFGGYLRQGTTRTRISGRKQERNRNSVSGKPEPEGRLKYPVPVIKNRNRNFKIPVPVNENRIGMAKFRLNPENLPEYNFFAFMPLPGILGS